MTLLSDSSRRYWGGNSLICLAEKYDFITENFQNLALDVYQQCSWADKAWSPEEYREKKDSERFVIKAPN